jgi:hypothetical protein
MLHQIIAKKDSYLIFSLMHGNLLDIGKSMDSYSKTTATSWFSNFMGSLSGIIIGPLLFIAAVIGLYFVEGQINYAKLAKNAPVFAAAENNPNAAQYPLVAINGTVALETTLGDGSYLIPQKYLMYEKRTEIYAWEETKSSSTINDSYGKTITRDTVTYSQTWTTNPRPSKSFEHPEGHENPAPLVNPITSGTQAIFKLGTYTVSTNSLELPVPKPLQLSPATVTVQAPSLIADNAIYTFINAKSSPDKPQIGDIRTTYSVLCPDQQNATVFGRVEGSNISVALLNEISSNLSSEGTFKRLFLSSPREAVATMNSEYAQKLRWGRFITFFVMFLGLLMLLSPFSTFLSIIPIIGGLAGMAVFATALLVAALCFGLTLILFSCYFDEPYWIINVVFEKKTR